MPRIDPKIAQPHPTRHLLASGLIALLVVLACAVRLVHLDADPHFPTWVSYVVDEGRWTESARNLVLFGTTDAFADRIHLILSPAFQAASYVAFRLTGVGFASARVTAAIAGILVVVATYLALRRHVSTFALALGVLILGFETNLLGESRMALPELPSVLGSLLAFLVLVAGPQNRRNAFAAGLLAALSVAMKGTSALVVPVFPLMILLDGRGCAWTPRLRRCAAFLYGFALPLAAGLAAAVGIGLVSVNHLDRMILRFLSFLSLADPRAAIWAVFESQAHEARNLMLLAAWFCSWPWLYRGPNSPAVVRSLYLMSGLWAAWWLLIWLGNSYSPGRYVVHFVVPATFHVMAGLTLLDRGTLGRVAAGFARQGPLVRATGLAWLALPTAILLATVLAAFGPLGGWDFSRVLSRFAAIAVLAALTAVAMWRWPPNEATIASLSIAPVVSVLLWLVGRELGLFRHFWAGEPSSAATTWAATLGLCYFASYLLATGWSAVKHHPALRIAVLALVAGPFMVHAAPPMVAPTYSIRDASRDLGLRFGCATEIRAMSAASMFLDNSLPYRELTRNELSRDERPYDILVLFDHNGLVQRFLGGDDAARLTRLGVYRLQVHPRYEFDEARDGSMRISVYAQRHAADGRCAASPSDSAQRAVAQHVGSDATVGARFGTFEREPVADGR